MTGPPAEKTARAAVRTSFSGPQSKEVSRLLSYGTSLVQQMNGALRVSQAHPIFPFRYLKYHVLDRPSKHNVELS